MNRYDMVPASIASERRSVTFALLASALLSVGCAGKRAVDPNDLPARLPDAPVVPVVVGADGTVSDLSAGEQAGRDALQRTGMVIYFDYDSAQIGRQYAELLSAHARYAGDHGGVTLRLEGHADERGSREYNVGLGERRAQAVRNALELQGVPLGRLSTVSYGEERPAASGSNEGSWSRNRRVEFIYSP